MSIFTHGFPNLRLFIRALAMQRFYTIIRRVFGLLKIEQDCGSYVAGMLFLNHGRQTIFPIALVLAFVFVLSKFIYGVGMGAHFLNTKTTNNIANVTLGVSYFS